MELSFRSADLRAICLERDVAATRLGYAAASELGQILADIDAFESFEEFNATFGHRIEDANARAKRFRMKESYSISFISGLPQHLGTNVQPTNWPEVYRLMIVAIEQTNV